MLFRVDAESDQLQLREAVADSTNQPQPIALWQREINHSDREVELTCALEQRDFVPHDHNRLELCLQKAA